MLNDLSEVLDVELNRFVTEHPLHEIESHVLSTLEQLQDGGPFPFGHNADLTLARCCYVMCRAIKPNYVLETGVAYGVTSAFILKALEVNGRGVLHSIDLPPLEKNADQYIGVLIPPYLKERWCLHRGVSKRLMPSLLRRLRCVDIFVHDSSHTYRNMHWEFETVWPYLRPGGVLIADDVNKNYAFNELRERTLRSIIVKEEHKKNLFGIAIKSAEQRRQRSICETQPEAWRTFRKSCSLFLLGAKSYQYAIPN